MLNIKALLTKLVSHYNATGTVISQSDTLSKMTSGTSLQTITDYTGTGSTAVILDPGIWIVYAGVEYPSNATGYRVVQIGYTENGTSTNVGVSRIQIPAVTSSYGCWLSTNCSIVTTSSWTLQLKGCQNSGSELSSIAWYLKAVKIK